jgi:hypothetical protein
VTLSKVCGQITMNGAALAGGAKVSFAVTNSKVVGDGHGDCFGCERRDGECLPGGGHGGWCGQLYGDG